MKRRLPYLPFLLLLFFSQTIATGTIAEPTGWTEEKIGKIAVKADKAATRNKWSRAIKYGERFLAAAEELYGKDHPRYVTRLKTLNRYYDKSGKLDKVAERVRLAYSLSKKLFKRDHDTVKVSHLLYYKLVVAQKDYSAAIPLVLKNIEMLSEAEDDLFKKLHYLGQLHGLYGITNQLERQETILVERLALSQKLMGPQLEDNLKIIMNLGKTYCLQGKKLAFNKLMQTHKLKFEC